MNFTIRSPVNFPLEKAAAAFDRDLFVALKPPLLQLEVLRFDGCKRGDEVHLQLGIGPLKQTWVSVITEDSQSEGRWQFVDEGKILPPPLNFWRHTHRIEKTDSQSCVIFDEVEFSCKNGVVEKLLLPVLQFQFSLRTSAYQHYFSKLSHKP